MPSTPLTIPERPPAPPGFAHMTSSVGTRTIHISGQVGTDASGETVPGGLAAQTEQAFLNVGAALKAAGAEYGDLAHLRIYIVGWTPSMISDFAQGGAAAAAQQSFPEVSVTLIGVSSLFTPDMLIEIEAVAVIDE